MKRYWEQLKPVERRWAAGILGVVFLMLNYFFIWPHFGDLKRDEFRYKRAHDTNEIYLAEARHMNEYKRKIRELESGGDEVLPEDQAIDFVRFLNSRSIANSIMLISQGNLVTQTNDYSINQQMSIGAQATETNLVNFLYSLSSGNSMMRVRSMNLHPDPSHQQLGASITLIASYQKKAPAPRGTSAASPAKAPVIPGPAAAPPKPLPTPKPPAYTNKMAAIPTRLPPGTNHLAGALSRPVASTNKPGSFIPRHQ